MIEAAIRLDSSNTSSGCKIFYFPKTKSVDETSKDSILNFLIGNPNFEDYLKDFIEGVIMNESKILTSSSLVTKDDPFDPIYIAELQPDKLYKDDILCIENLASKIVDKSHLLFIDDGWDD